MCMWVLVWVYLGEWVGASVCACEFNQMFERVRRSLLINSNASKKNFSPSGFFSQSLDLKISMTLMKILISLKQFFFHKRNNKL